MRNESVIMHILKYLIKFFLRFHTHILNITLLVFYKMSIKYRDNKT